MNVNVLSVNEWKYVVHNLSLFMLDVKNLRPGRIA